MSVNPSSSKPVSWNTATLVGEVREVFAGLLDTRKPGNNRRYEMEDVALSAFAVFFTQSPSFLDYQIRMEELQGKNNATSLFGVHQIPSDNQIRQVLDPVPPEALFGLMARIGDEIYQQGHLASFRSIENTFLIALDGTTFFSSQKISCPCCSQARLTNGKTQYRHAAVTPVVVAPGQDKVVVLPPEFVVPQDGNQKQDSEIAASKRWLAKWAAHYGGWGGVTYLGDDLYCHQPFCEEVRGHGAHFIFTCKPSSHTTAYEWISSLAQSDGIITLAHPRRQGKKQFTDTYRFVNGIPLRDGKEAITVNWFELTTTNDKGEVIYTNAWATSHHITQENLIKLVQAGRSRWKIENENNNTLKTKGYHFEHNFGHGKKHLANILATLNLLAFLSHTALEYFDSLYRIVRNLLPSRRTFFEHLRALTQYIHFNDWAHLMRFMLKGLGVTLHDTG
jgi:hypothetical protein